MKLTNFCTGMLLLVSLSACSGLFPAPIQTPTPVPPTGTPTATTVWFPPTDTPTIFPTLTVPASPDQRPGLGQLLFTDSFDQPDLWSTSAASWASASVTRNRLILSISGQGPISIISLRSQPLLGDFYAEALITLSLCGENNQFGMIFRAAPGESYYRFVVNCAGQVRMERSISASLMPLLDWLSSGDAPNAAPAEVRVGIWAAGSELRFFLNDRLQFTVRDPLLHTGTLGFFAFAGGDAPLTVSFSDLSAYSVVYLSPTPSLTPSRTPVPSRTPTP